MIPLRDDVAARTTPLVTVTLIALNAVVFLYQASLGLGPSIAPPRRSSSSSA